MGADVVPKKTDESFLSLAQVFFPGAPSEALKYEMQKMGQKDRVDGGKEDLWEAVRKSL